MKGRLHTGLAVTATAISPKRRRDTTVMDRGSSDEAIVGVKSVADEDAVTYLRVKLPESGSNAGAEGWNMLHVSGISK